MRADEDGSAAALWAMAHLGTPMAVRVAATLRLADHLAGGLRTAPELARAVHADADALERLLRYLAARGLLVRDGAGGYALTPLAEPLRDGHPARLRAALDLEGMGGPDLAFAHLLHCVRTGEAGFARQFGRTFWEHLAGSPALAEAFDAQMGADAAARAPDIVAGFDWASLGHVVDVGGGNGTLLLALLAAFPTLRGTVVDRADAVAAARAALAGAGLDGRGRAVVGDFFEPLPPGAGGYVLSQILHDWPDAEAQVILRRCAEAAGHGGRVLVVADVGADGESPSTGMDLRMLACFGGRERGVGEVAALASGAGLRLTGVHPAGALSILELLPSPGSA